ncbi:hypothetical protein TMU3MR103_1421 [Tetragenococcus muriaticus 3MR10-3]|uniref:Uncharacterized protein n=1 Tax=Tetragenococcus muriaticus 3MR10-3 TaxID=1302648 RepID=A0A091CCM7_9ENTE|nr:hypothetical protein TMU3MR103_1421 [Tetragenococcus muriaticus 3MR10-3]
MELTIKPEALDWFKREITLEPGMGIRFFGKAYGSTQVHDGFSIGMSVDSPEKPMVEKDFDVILFLQKRKMIGSLKVII